MYRGILALGLAGGLCSCTPQENEATAEPFSIYGNWYGSYSESGKMNVCSISNCKYIPYSQKNERYLRFDPDGSGSGRKIYMRNNDGDTSESFQRWDSLVWSMTSDSLYIVLTALKYGSGAWEHQDTTQPYAKQGIGYAVAGGKITLKDYLPIDSMGTRIDLTLSKK